MHTILKQLTLPLGHEYSSTATHAFYSACTHATFVQWMVCMMHVIIWSAQTYGDYTQRNNLFLYVVFWVFLVNVLWSGMEIRNPAFLLPCMIGEYGSCCKELSLPCPHNSWLMWKWHGWNLWLAWTCLFKSCMENNGGLFLRHKNYFSGGETRKKETEKQFIRHSYQPAWRYHTEISQHEGLGLFTLVI